MEDYERFQEFTTVDLNKIADAGYEFDYDEMKFCGEFTNEEDATIVLESFSATGKTRQSISFDFKIIYNTETNDCLVLPRLIVQDIDDYATDGFYLKADEDRWKACPTNIDKYEGRIETYATWVCPLSKQDLKTIKL